MVGYAPTEGEEGRRGRGGEGRRGREGGVERENVVEEEGKGKGKRERERGVNKVTYFFIGIR